MQDTPKGLRLHIGLFGKRNSGKSTLMNALIGQSVSIVSAHPGTTTDPVEKAYELAPLGAVVFVDTAGLDDEGELGALRVQKTRAVLERVDLALIVVDDGRVGTLERALIATLRSTPEAIKPEVSRLVARLRARWSTEDALLKFADELDDATGDLVAAYLIETFKYRLNWFIFKWPI